MNRPIFSRCATSVVLLACGLFACGLTACGGESIDRAGPAKSGDAPDDQPQELLPSDSLADEVAHGTALTTSADEPWRPDGLVAHEWGTFTAVQSSTGTYLEGLHHEEEPLPAFVHRIAYDGVSRATAFKGMSYLPEPVTQKMETPVIYFYADKPQRVTVSVDFPEGVISEWYPQSVASQSSLDDGRLAGGAMDWMVDLSHEPVELIEVSDDDIWAPARDVPDAMYVSRGLDADRFIFYRGLGRFEPPFRVTNDGETFAVANLSSQRIENVYLLEVTEESGRIHALGGVGGFARIEATLASHDAPMPIDQLVDQAKETVSQGLVASGLTEDESRAMVETWSRSYFRTPGIRVLYTVPRAWTDELLPLRIEPEPDELVRTLVGRVEVLTPKDEEAAVDEVLAAYERGDTNFYLDAPIRFSEPRLRRACQSIVDHDVAAWCLERADKMMHSVMQMPF